VNLYFSTRYLKWEQLSGKYLKKAYISVEDFLAGMKGINIYFCISPSV
jgi:hypothetical protein